MRRLIEGDPLYDNAGIQESGKMSGLMLVPSNTISCSISDDTVWIDARVETYVVPAEYGEMAICIRVFFVTNEYVNEGTTNQCEASNRYYEVFPIAYKSYKHMLKNSQYAKELMMRYIDEYFLQYSKSSKSWDEFIKDKMDKEIEEYEED